VKHGDYPKHEELSLKAASRSASLLNFEKKSGFIFKNTELLNLAFTHRSYANELQMFGKDNERLEFLGDSVLGLCIAHLLYLRFPQNPRVI